MMSPTVQPLSHVPHTIQAERVYSYCTKHADFTSPEPGTEPKYAFIDTIGQMFRIPCTQSLSLNNADLR